MNYIWYGISVKPRKYNAISQFNAVFTSDIIALNPNGSTEYSLHISHVFDILKKSLMLLFTFCGSAFQSSARVFTDQGFIDREYTYLSYTCVTLYICILGFGFMYAWLLRPFCGIFRVFILHVCWWCSKSIVITFSMNMSSLSKNETLMVTIYSLILRHLLFCKVINAVTMHLVWCVVTPNLNELSYSLVLIDCLHSFLQFVNSLFLPMFLLLRNLDKSRRVLLLNFSLLCLYF